MPCLSPQAGSSLRLAVGKPSSRPRFSPCTTSPEVNQGAPRSSAASTTLPRLSAVRTAPEETGRPSSSSGGTMSTVKPSRAPCSARYAGEPARFWPKWKSKPIAAPPMPRLPTRMRETKSSAEVDASAASKRMMMAPSSPVAARSRSLSRSEESWNRASCGRKKARGCGVKVSAAVLRPSWSARARAAPITARWPRCTPSKLPIATTASTSASASMPPAPPRTTVKLFAENRGVFIIAWGWDVWPRSWLMHR